MLWFQAEIDFEVKLRSENAPATPACLAPITLRQMGYYYYLLFVDGYSKSSVRSPLRQGSLGETALEIWSLVPRATREPRVIKVHLAIAIRSAGCLTLHLTSGFCCPCSTDNRDRTNCKEALWGWARRNWWEGGCWGGGGGGWNGDFIALFGLLLVCPCFTP